jgi:hypothetical protein
MLKEKQAMKYRGEQKSGEKEKKCACSQLTLRNGAASCWYACEPC